MAKNFFTRFRWFWAWQDEKEEAWLGKMSKQGYHLSSIGFPGFYTFNKGEPKEYVYRLDYQNFRKKDRQEYLQLFRDAGWEHLGEIAAWQYFRKEARPGETNEIFTDKESKIGKYKRVIYYSVFFYLIFIALFAGRITGDIPYRWWDAIQIIYLVIFLLLTYAIIRLALRIRKVKKS
jgi:Protein of unknown function (DUF2812)